MKTRSLALVLLALSLVGSALGQHGNREADRAAVARDEHSLALAKHSLQTSKKQEHDLLAMLRDDRRTHNHKAAASDQAHLTKLHDAMQARRHEISRWEVRLAADKRKLRHDMRG